MSYSVEEVKAMIQKAYDWGYSDGQNNPNGYPDPQEVYNCVEEIITPEVLRAHEWDEIEANHE